MTALHPIEVLVSEVAARATAAAWAVSREERFETVNQLQSDTLLTALQGTPAKERHDVPERRVALLVRHSVRLLVAAFDSEADLLGACRKALWWAGLVRGSLHPISRSDLYLFIVATPAKGSEESVLRDRSRIEADERICRKHVWLPTVDGSAADFLDATFLARPWHKDALAPQSLDPLHRLVETAGLAPDLATAWVGALSRLDEVKMDAIADALSSLYEDRDGD